MKGLLERMTLLFCSIKTKPIKTGTHCSLVGFCFFDNFIEMIYYVIMSFLVKNKKVLLVGLGTLGGGLAMANFLIREGAKLTITDLKNRHDLAVPLSKLCGFVDLVLGEMKEQDFKNNEIIIFNSAVYYKNQRVLFAEKERKTILNDYLLFDSCLKKRKQRITIGVTGTRGKTTVTNWIHHFLPDFIMGGNMPNMGLLDIIPNTSKKENFVLELSSSQLEFGDKNTNVPHIAVITNIYEDHLNRYQGIEEYMDAKANIFLNQTEKDFLILSKDNQYTDYFLAKKPKANIYFVSLKNLPENLSGLFVNEFNEIIFQENGQKNMIIEIAGDMPIYKKNNLLDSMLATFLQIKNWKIIKSKIDTLPQILFRQEIIYNNEQCIVVNDSASTIPEATMVAIDSLKDKNKELFLITGGTDKNLNFSELADKIKRDVKKENFYLLFGSATKKLVQALIEINYFTKNEEVKIYDSLEKIIIDLLVKINKKSKNTILFSPGASSFELFLNEFDRGNKFNGIINKIFNKDYLKYGNTKKVNTTT